MATVKQEEQQLIGNSRQIAEKFPPNSWKAPRSPNETYPGKVAFPLANTAQCSAHDMQVLNYWASKQAKNTLPMPGYDGTFKTGRCYTNNRPSDYWFNVNKWASCYQEFYDISTPCAQCIGSLYNMAIYNWSDRCYNFCKGRPHRKDGPLWCWEDCQQCMWYIGRKLSDCYGEPYDMVCRYAKELGKEGYFEKNGIDPKR